MYNHLILKCHVCNGEGFRIFGWGRNIPCGTCKGTGTTELGGGLFSKGKLVSQPLSPNTMTTAPVAKPTMFEMLNCLPQLIVCDGVMTELKLICNPESTTIAPPNNRQ